MNYDIIAIGASMGGFQALKQIISELPKDFKTAVLIVLHIPAEHESFLADIFGRKSKVPVHPAVNGDVIKAGHVYIAVPDYHLKVEKNHIVLDHGPKHNFHRPSVDTLFTSVALSYGTRAIGVILTGALDDGTAGMMDIKRHGGMCIVQDPKDAAYPSMPASVLETVEIDHCVPLKKMSKLLISIAGKTVKKEFSEQSRND
jgi:two-component system chemotaxis response regulator CheB